MEGIECSAEGGGEDSSMCEYLQWFFENLQHKGGGSANGQSRNSCREARRFTAIIITHSLAKHSIPTTGLLFFHVRKLHKTARSGWDVLRWTINKVRWKHSLSTHKYKALHVELKILWSATPTPSFCRPKQNECGLTIQSFFRVGRRVTGCRYHQTKVRRTLTQ